MRFKTTYVITYCSDCCDKLPYNSNMKKCVKCNHKEYLKYKKLNLKKCGSCGMTRPFNEMLCPHCNIVYKKKIH